MIEPILMLLTAIWVLTGAILIMPHFAEKKMTRKGGRIDNLETNFNKRLDSIEEKIPVDIPSMVNINKSIDHIGQSTVDNINNLQKNIPQLIIDTIKTDEFHTEIKSYEGRMYAAKGIDIDKFKKLTAGYTHGMEAAEKVYIDKIQNGSPDDRTELTLILRDALQLAEENGFIEEGSTEQKIGLVQGVMRLIDRLQNRGNTSSPTNGGRFPSTTPSSPLPSGGGSELDTYYR